MAFTIFDFFSLKSFKGPVWKTGIAVSVHSVQCCIGACVATKFIIISEEHLASGTYLIKALAVFRLLSDYQQESNFLPIQIETDLSLSEQV